MVCSIIGFPLKLITFLFFNLFEPDLAGMIATCFIILTIHGENIFYNNF